MRALTLITLLLFILPPLHAENGTDTALKDAAIAGTLLSWTLAWLRGDTTPNAVLPAYPQHMATTGGSASQTHMAQLIYARDFSGTLLQGQHWRLKGYWEASLALWQADNGRRANNDGWMIGLTPVLQWQLKRPLRPYLETGIGLQYLFDIRLADQYKSSQLQFGDLIGIGVQYRNLKVGFRFLHISNGGIETPNPGTNYYTLRMDYLLP